MLIPFSNCMVAGMETTFSELKAKHLKLLETQWQLREKLQDKAGELLREYAESLSLPADTWTDSLGKIHPYVDIGTWSDQGNLNLFPWLVCKWMTTTVLTLLLPQPWMIPR